MLKLTEHKGKMENIPSLSTSCTVNPFCKKMQKNKTAICSKCYGKRYENMYQNLTPKLVKNGKLLSKELIDIPKYNVVILRFNAFGELLNITHLDNLVRITQANPQTTFTLWTKRKDLINEYFSVNPKPENLILVYSSPQLNVTEELPLYFDKVFTVFTKDQAVTINCGSKNCFECQTCYSKNDTVNINEVIK